MAYSDFKLSEVSQRFGLTVNEASGMFASEYYIKDIKKILGILVSAIRQE